MDSLEIAANHYQTALEQLPDDPYILSFYGLTLNRLGKDQEAIDQLEKALEHFELDVKDFTVLDAGLSTGGFTDCLLQNGAKHVYSIDVGKGILHWKLRQDERITIMESTNARYVERLPEPIDLVTIDASFISLKILLPVAKNWLQNAPSQKKQDQKARWHFE